MLKILRNFIIGLLIGTIIFSLALPYFYFHESPMTYYSTVINDHLRETQDKRQLARFFSDDGMHLPILTYRTFVDENEEGEPVEPGITLRQFEEQMKTLKEINCTFITPNDLAYAIDQQTALPPRSVLITFDDCNEEIYTKAFPILKKYQIHASINIIGYYTDHYSNYKFPLLNWEQIHEMDDSGLIDFQSETYYSFVPQLNIDGSTSYPFTDMRQKEDWDDYWKRITRDLFHNNVLIFAKTGKMPIALAYPHNKSTANTKKALESTNLKFGYDSFNNKCLNLVNWIDPYHLPRIEMNQNFNDMQEFLLFINTY